MLFSEEDLSKYDGKDKPMYLAIVGSVFDVTPGRNFYEPGTAYNCFVGRDGSRAFATGEFSPSGARPDLAGLNNEMIEEIQQWVDKFTKKYKLVGHLVGLYYDSEGNPTQELLAFSKKVVHHRNQKGTKWNVDFVVDKKNLKKFKFIYSPVKPLEQEQILVEVQKFGLTSNNITYASLGNAYRYFDFFPTEEGWGIIPVWALGLVIESKNSGVKVGERIYGYFPFSSFAILQPHSFTGGSFYVLRNHLPPDRKVYNQYYLSTQDPFYKSIHEDEMLIYRPLFFTSFFLEDFLRANNLFDAEKVVILSASSKTAICLALLLHAHNIPVVGLTSRGNLEFVRKLGYYQECFSYQDIHLMNPRSQVVVTDMAGNNVVLNQVYEYFQNNMKACIGVGLTHYDQPGAPSIVPKQKKQVFFAPAWIKKRQEELGFALVDLMKTGWNLCLQNSHKWTALSYGHGQTDCASVYKALAKGSVDPQQAWILSVWDRSKI